MDIVYVLHFRGQTFGVDSKPLMGRSGWVSNRRGAAAHVLRHQRVGGVSSSHPARGGEVQAKI